MEYDELINIRVEGRVILGSKSHFSGSHGNYLPGEPTDVQDFKVFVGPIEITQGLSDDEIERLKTDYIETYLEEVS